MTLHYVLEQISSFVHQLARICPEYRLFELCPAGGHSDLRVIRGGRRDNQCLHQLPG
jgi:hypothetical protein